jgi:hypothetical protein
MKTPSIVKQIWKNPRKIKARENTIVSIYQKKYKLKKVPPEEQYWTMCGNLTDNLGNANESSEYLQMVSSGFITSNQFYGVENQKVIHDMNKAIYPDINLYHDDFFWAMNSFAVQRKFNPAIVNADTIYLQKKAAPFIARIIYLLSQVPKNDIMLVANIVLDHPYKGHKKRDINCFLEFLAKEKKWKDCADKWEFHKECYFYQGNSKVSKAEMCSYIFFKK